MGLGEEGVEVGLWGITERHGLFYTRWLCKKVTAGPPRRTRDACDELAVALGKATLALGRAGQPVEALRLAAAGYAAVRREHPEAARRLNGVMHSLARLPDVPKPTTTRSPPCPTPTSTSAPSHPPAATS